MSAFKKIAAVTEGSYSDYRVLAVCECADTAKAWADAVGGSVEWIDVLPAGMPPTKDTIYSYSVTFWDDGRIEKGRINADTKWSICHWQGAPPTRPRLRFVRAPCHGGKGGRLDIVASSAEACLKVASDRKAMWLAGAWNTRELREWTNQNEEETTE